MLLDGERLCPCQIDCVIIIIITIDRNTSLLEGAEFSLPFKRLFNNLCSVPYNNAMELLRSVPFRSIPENNEPPIH